MTILDEIRRYKREFVAETKRRVHDDELRRQAADAPPTRGFARALRGMRDASGRREAQATLRLTAEIKKASPSKGVIRADFDPAAIARSYEAAGASALSVLTDEKYFQGSLDALKAARAASDLPILRKEFMLHPLQVYEARAAGADAILLIAGFIEWSELADLRGLARDLALDVLLEVHHEDELDAALELQPDVLGINNRDLRHREFGTDLSVTERLLARVPDGITLMSESGIRGEEDVARLAALGVDAILVGEHLMREADPGRAIADKFGLRAARETPVK